MCLNALTSKKPLVATEDIIVYKYLKRERNPFLWAAYSLKAPYNDWKKYVFGEVNKSSLLVETSKDFAGELHLGLHSHMFLDEAEDAARMLEQKKYTASYDFVVVKCTIPAGSNYYVGEINGRLDLRGQMGYASDTLVVNGFGNSREVRRDFYYRVKWKTRQLVWKVGHALRIW